MIHWQEDVSRAMADISDHGRDSSLAFGCGRSYGDSCLAESDHVLAMQGMDRVQAVDWETGVVFAQSGLTLAELIRLALPRGWFLPVTPGTKFVTLGGAVANDVHGKNHHVMGTFGRHVRRLVMFRSDTGIVECSPCERSDLFAATVGGLGLTGVILAVELQLRRISSSEIEQRSIRFGGLDEFFDLSQTYDASHEYTVAWIDCLASGKQTGRGRYIAGTHAQQGPLEFASPNGLHMPIDPPFSLVNSLSLRAFNTLYYYHQRKKEIKSRVGYDPFFYPLDHIQQWNRMYGRAGFQQYQCVVPQRHGREVIRAVIQEIIQSGTGSFLAVLKQCGELGSPGLLSFPVHGVSLALDFPQRDLVNKRLFNKLDALVNEAGGRLYPAKDAHMSAIHFKRAYPDWHKVEALRDPQLMSRFWRRVTQ
jgi:FAD/FMN-containing dehydrogenase